MSSLTRYSYKVAFDGAHTAGERCDSRSGWTTILRLSLITVAMSSNTLMRSARSTASKWYSILYSNPPFERGCLDAVGAKACCNNEKDFCTAAGRVSTATPTDSSQELMFVEGVEVDDVVSV